MTNFLKLNKLLVCLVLSFMLAGCGVRGSLEYPAQSQAQKKASAESGQGKPRGAAPKPHKGFILDGLLQ